MKLVSKQSLKKQQKKQYNKQKLQNCLSLLFVLLVQILIYYKKSTVYNIFRDYYKMMNVIKTIKSPINIIVIQQTFNLIHFYNLIYDLFNYTSGFIKYQFNKRAKKVERI